MLDTVNGYHGTLTDVYRDIFSGTPGEPYQTI